MSRKDEWPLRRHGYCAGCLRFIELVLVGPSRHRCDECAGKELHP